MSILDRLNLFSNEQAITASTASTDIIDLGSTRDVGAGEMSTVLILVTAALDNLTMYGRWGGELSPEFGDQLPVSYRY
jgi:hypothetical protein